MPIFVAALIGGLVSAAGSLVGRVLIALCIGFVSFKGMDVLLSAIKSSVAGNLSGLPAGVIGLMGLFKVGTMINILWSAVSIRLTLNGLTSGSIKKMVVK